MEDLLPQKESEKSVMFILIKFQGPIKKLYSNLILKLKEVYWPLCLEISNNEINLGKLEKENASLVKKC